MFLHYPFAVGFCSYVWIVQNMALDAYNSSTI